MEGTGQSERSAPTAAPRTGCTGRDTGPRPTSADSTTSWGSRAQEGRVVELVHLEAAGGAPGTGGTTGTRGVRRLAAHRTRPRPRCAGSTRRRRSGRSDDDPPAGTRCPDAATTRPTSDRPTSESGCQHAPAAASGSTRATVSARVSATVSDHAACHHEPTGTEGRQRTPAAPAPRSVRTGPQLGLSRASTGPHGCAAEPLAAVVSAVGGPSLSTCNDITSIIGVPVSSPGGPSPRRSRMPQRVVQRAQTGPTGPLVTAHSSSWPQVQVLAHPAYCDGLVGQRRPAILRWWSSSASSRTTAHAGRRCAQLRVRARGLR